MIDAELFQELYTIFPEAFNTTREYKKHKIVSTPWGLEEIEIGTGNENLAENILYTAQAVANSHGLDFAIKKYLSMFKRKSVQRQELKNWK